LLINYGDNLDSTSGGLDKLHAGDA